MRKNIWHRWRPKSVIRVVMVVGISAALMVQAQEVVPTSQSGSALTAGPRLGADLQRTVALNLENVTLKEALQAVAAQAGIVISYGTTVVPVTNRVSLVSSSITVRDALTSLLQNTGTEAVAVAPGLIAVRPTDGRSASDVFGQQGSASIAGYVRDSATGASIPQVTVRIDGTTLQIKSGSDGQYKITAIAAGEYRVTARRVGYLSKTRTITLNDGDTRTLNFELNPPATQLNEVVTTALGEQRRYQVGNVISTINVDSIAPTAPVTSITDLMTGRAPGVDIVETNGLVGAGEDIRIRGESSMLLQSDPIIIVDGIRQDNSPGGTYYFEEGHVPSPSRINDIDFSQIETIDILKGPAATTEYGTDAANGVIIITTKRGTSGTPQWNVSATQSASTVPSNAPNIYWNWGHLTDGSDQSVFASNGSTCALWNQLANRSCVVDSTTAFNPLNHAATTEYGTGPGNKYDLTVGGGSDALRYYLAAGVENAEGVLHMPDVFRSEAQSLGYSEGALQPNSENQGSLRANTNIRVSATADVNASVAFLSTYQEIPQGEFGTTLVQGTQNYGGELPSIDDSAYMFGYGSPNPSYAGNSPLANLGSQNSQQTERWTGGLTADWRPAAWVATNATVGLDHGTQTEQYMGRAR